MQKKVALITGVTGQDGAYLSELIINRKFSILHKKDHNFLIMNKRDHLYWNPKTKNQKILVIANFETFSRLTLADLQNRNEYFLIHEHL
jgi:GDP-D-mannose dehydratase